MNQPEAEQRWSLVLYEDLEDSYVTQLFDFTASTKDFSARFGGGQRRQGLT
jgi:hypothetical protein